MPFFGPPRVDKLEARGDVKRLVTALRHEDTAIRRRSAMALGKVGDPEAVLPLVAALKDPDPSVRVEAASALGMVGDGRAGSALVAVLTQRPERSVLSPPKQREGQRRLRTTAAEALGRIGGQDAVRALVAALEDDEPVRTASAGALDALDWRPDGGPAEVAYWLAKDDPDRCARMGPAAVEPLTHVLARGPVRDRVFAAQVLGEVGDERALDALTNAFEAAASDDTATTSNGEILRSLGAIGDPSCVEFLIAALDTRSPQQRSAAVSALERIGEPAVAPLVAGLRRHERLRAAAAEALDRIGWHPSDEVDAVAYWIAKGDEQRCVDIGPAAIGPLAVLLDDGTGAERTLAANALGRLEHPDSLAALTAAAAQDPTHVLGAASKALGELACRLVTGGWRLDDRRLAGALGALTRGATEPDRRTWGRDDDYKAFDDGWSGIGSQALATTQAMGDAIVARWVSEGSADSISDLDIEGLTDKLFECLGCELDWHTRGLVAAALVDHGTPPADPRLGSAIADLTAWANRSDDTEEIEPMVQENRCYQAQRTAADTLLERLR